MLVIKSSADCLCALVAALMVGAMMLLMLLPEGILRHDLVLTIVLVLVEVES